MGRLKEAYSSVSWKKRQTLTMETNYKREALRVRWVELKQLYPWQNIRKEWDAFKKWWEKKNGKQLTFNMSTLTWFNDTWLKNKPAPPVKPKSFAELEQSKILYAEGQKQAIELLLTNFGMNLSDEVRVLIKDACIEEGLYIGSVNDWLESTGNRPNMNKTKELYQLVLKFKTNG